MVSSDPDCTVYLQGERCVTSCTNGTYTDQEKRICVDHCDHHQFIYNVTYCVQECPRHTYISPDHLRECLVCHSQCATCVGPTAQGCTECRHYRLGDTCVDSCPEGYFQMESTCTAYCDFYLFEDKCVRKCPFDHYVAEASNDTASRCLPCHPLCEGCQGPDDTDCTNCTGVLLGNRCIQTCPKQMPFLDKQHCTERCPNFIDGNLCVDFCPNNTFIMNRTCLKSCPPTIPSGQKCVSVCEGFVFDEKCLKYCPLPNLIWKKECVKSCPNSAPLIQEGRCVTNCSGVVYGKSCLRRCPGRLKTYKRHCVLHCPKDLPVSDPLTMDCTKRCNYIRFRGQCLKSCPGYYLELNKSCVMRCPLGTAAQDGKCVTICTASRSKMDRSQHSGIFTNGTCKFDCDYWTSKCTVECPRYAYNGKCVTRCPENYFANVSNCLPCNSLCTGDNLALVYPTYACKGLTSADCTKCRYFNDTNTGRCVRQCPSELLTSGTDCVQKCPRNTYKAPRTPLCQATCPTGFMKNKVDMTCVKTCPKHLVIHADQCSLKCPTNTYSVRVMDTNICTDHCPANYSLKDDVNGKCVNACAQPLVRNDKRCLEKCPDGWVIDLMNCKRICPILRPFKEAGHCVTHCSKHLVLQKKDCIEKCPKLTDIHGCVETCPQERRLHMSRHCVKACNQSYYINADECLPSCPYDTLEDAGYCMPNCSLANTYRYKGHCLAECPKGTWPSLERNYNSEIGKLKIYFIMCSEKYYETAKSLLIILSTILLILLVFVCWMAKRYYVHYRTRTPVEDLKILQDKEVRDELYSI